MSLSSLVVGGQLGASNIEPRSRVETEADPEGRTSLSTQSGVVGPPFLFGRCSKFWQLIINGKAEAAKRQTTSHMQGYNSFRFLLNELT